MITVSLPAQMEIDEKAIRKTTQNIALDVAKLIRDRTRQNGKDVNGSDFAEYSDATQKRKAKQGKPSFVNLTDHSNMINGVHVSAVLGGYEIYIADTFNNKKAYWHQTGAGNLPKREWFGISKPDTEKIYQKYGRTLKIFKGSFK